MDEWPVGPRGALAPAFYLFVQMILYINENRINWVRGVLCRPAVLNTEAATVGWWNVINVMARLHFLLGAAGLMRGEVVILND